MPKQKTHSASKKRFKISGSGKVVRPRAHKKHKLTCKSAKQKRNLRGTCIADKSVAKNIKVLIPYK
ncbi:MAG: 50S ribosomal protein L35 [Eubacteriales bacterium]|nr:50S ribosomal protein L35 [Eubacteriales bacterium]